jgi:uncharacterized membrane protein YedE/YeeE
MKLTSTALFSGTLFGAGLGVSQMTNPAKVIGFLDVGGAWDPTLAFVMGSALLVAAAAFQLKRILDAGGGSLPVSSPAPAGIDGRLILGASIFGLGWGLAGFCPGPAIAALVTGSGQVVLFVCSMLGGMGLFRLVAQPTAAHDEQREASRHAA